MLKINDPAPAFDLPSTEGGRVSLASMRGHKFVLYFYPKDDTPGCTVEACDFRDNLARVKSHGARVFGVSKDSLSSHGKFRAKYDLPFDLLTDADNSVAKAYGAYGQKLMYGKPVTGTIRSTFLIDERGKIAAVWSPVKVAGHVDAVLAALKGESAPKSTAAKAKPARASSAAKAPAAKAPAKKAATKSAPKAQPKTTKASAAHAPTRKPSLKKAPAKRATSKA